MSQTEELVVQHGHTYERPYLECSHWQGDMQVPQAAENLNPSWFKNPLCKSQDLHLNAVPTTYAKRSLRKRGSHTQALRFGTAQPFWTLSQRCCNTNNEPNQTSKKVGLNHVAVLEYFFAVSLALSQNQPYSWTATNRLNIQDPKIFLQKTFFH